MLDVPDTVEVGKEGNAVRLVGRHPDHDDLIDWTREDFPLVQDTAHFVRDRHERLVQIELTPVLRHIGVIWERQQQISERRILHLLDGHAHHRSAEQHVGLHIFPSEDEAADLGQRLWPSRSTGIVWSSGPKRFLVELNSFLVGLAENHRCETTIADRESFRPLLGRLAIPQNKFRVPVGSGARGAALQLRRAEGHEHKQRYDSRNVCGGSK